MAEFVEGSLKIASALKTEQQAHQATQARVNALEAEVQDLRSKLAAAEVQVKQASAGTPDPAKVSAVVEKLVRAGRIKAAASSSAATKLASPNVMLQLIDEMIPELRDPQMVERGEPFRMPKSASTTDKAPAGKRWLAAVQSDA